LAQIASTQVKRVLKTRHLSMIALGGSIGTGLFVASGSAIATAGPGGAIAAYIGIGLMVFFLMTSLGEMATYAPVSGSFSEYASRFVDPALGFALGWNYWLNWAITLAVDVSTTAIVMHFWVPNVPGWLISVTFLSLIFVINLISAKSFAETEYWLSLVKVITVIVFLGVGLLTIVGIMGETATPIGLKNYTLGDAPFVGGLPATLSVFVVAGFSFQGTELIGITAGESETPETSIPKAIKQVFWRILLFYILSIAVIAAIIPYTNPNLLSGSVKNVAVSPFTLVFNRIGMAGAASLMNAVILTSVLSSANSGMYASTRMLWAMGSSGFAPRIFQKTNGRGVPIAALLLTTVIGALTFLTSIMGPSVYQLLVAASGLTGFLAWLGIAVSHLRFRRAFVKQGHSVKELRYHAKWFPVGPILAIMMSLIVIVGQDMSSLADFQWGKLLISYMSIPIFLILFVYYKVKHKTKLIPLDQIDLASHHDQRG
jgi:lysine-specific permease